MEFEAYKPWGDQMKLVLKPSHEDGLFIIYNNSLSYPTLHVASRLVMHGLEESQARQIEAGNEEVIHEYLRPFEEQPATYFAESSNKTASIIDVRRRIGEAVIHRRIVEVVPYTPET